MKKFKFLKEICKLLIVVLLASSCHKKEHSNKAEMKGDSPKTTKAGETPSKSWRPYYSWLKPTDGC